MKKFEIPKKKTPNPLHELEEETRLNNLADFERLQFPSWLEYMTAVSGLKTDVILKIIHYASFNGFVGDLKTTDEGMSYKRYRFPLGKTPIEIASLIFSADHWKFGKPIEQRPVFWNPKHGEARAITFQNTLRVMKVHSRT